jgi:hypothetical protein
MESGKSRSKGVLWKGRGAQQLVLCTVRKVPYGESSLERDLACKGPHMTNAT